MGPLASISGCVCVWQENGKEIERMNDRMEREWEQKRKKNRMNEKNQE